MDLLRKISGWCGMVLIVTAYYMISNQMVTGDSFSYQMMNVSGTILMAIDVYGRSWGAFTLQCVWFAIAAKALWPILMG